MPLYEITNCDGSPSRQRSTSQNLQPQLAGRKIVFENRRIPEVFEDRRKQFDAPDDEDRGFERYSEGSSLHGLEAALSQSALREVLFFFGTSRRSDAHTQPLL